MKQCCCRANHYKKEVFMKTANIRNAVSSSTMPRAAPASFNPEEKQPCWYANLELGDDREAAKWIVGVKKEGEDNVEHSFYLSSAGDIKDNSFWDYAVSLKFAVRLVDVFRSGGHAGVKGLVSDGLGEMI